jgi:hypothetical protein
MLHFPLHGNIYKTKKNIRPSIYEVLIKGSLSIHILKLFPLETYRFLIAQDIEIQ